MVKTKVVKKQEHERKTSYVSKKSSGKGDKKIIEKNLFEAKALKKGEYRTADHRYGDMGEDEHNNLPDGMNNGWWQSMKDGESCRTFDSNKVHAAISLSIKENKGINIQGIPEGKYYAFYMTRIMTEVETKRPEKKGKHK